MNILPQILDISSKNFITNQISYIFSQEIYNLLTDKSYSMNYVNFMLDFQRKMNQLCAKFLPLLFETLDYSFKFSKERKKYFVINKSNVERTLITIYGTFTFKRTLYQHKITGEYYFYVDDILDLEAYRNYDPIVRAILVSDSTLTNPSHTSSFSSLYTLDLNGLLSKSISIPKSTIYQFKRETKIRKINYKEIPTPSNTLYVMVDEKWIHKQDKSEPGKKKWIMSKCFVTFTGINRKGKRSRLVGRHIFITSSDTPWQDFMQEIYSIYNFENIKNINLLSDAGSWILSGAYELKLYSNNKVTINTCEFHVKQKICRSTTDKKLREEIANIIYELKDKKAFIKVVDKLIEDAPKDSRKQKITEYKNYIVRHWQGILNMCDSLCKSSMEAHIQHCIASDFSEVPKAYSDKYIETYLKLQELALNGISIFDYYLQTYQSDENFIFDIEKEEVFSPDSPSSNIPLIHGDSHVSTVLRSIVQ